MSDTIKSWSYLRIVAVVQAVVVMYMYLFMGRDVQDSTFFLVAAIFLWLVGEKKEQVEVMFMPLKKEE